MKPYPKSTQMELPPGTKLILKEWGCEVHTCKNPVRKEGEKPVYVQTGAAVETPPMDAVQHTLGRELTLVEALLLLDTGMLTL